MLKTVSSKIKSVRKKNLRKEIRSYFKDSLFVEQRFLYILIAVMVVFFVNLFFIIMNIKSESTALPVRYNYLYGITATGGWPTLFVPLVAEIAVIAMNFFFANYFFKKDKFLSYVFASVNILISIIIFSQTVAIIAQGE